MVEEMTFWEEDDADRTMPEPERSRVSAGGQ
jgi:hypothetical protein